MVCADCDYIIPLATRQMKVNKKLSRLLENQSFLKNHHGQVVAKQVFSDLKLSLEKTIII